MPITLLRFRDIKECGIAASWSQLRNLIKKYGFPLGRMISPNVRAWHEAEIDSWLASRPTAGPELRGAAKARRGRPRKQATVAPPAAAVGSPEV
jgi:predicted DNA-binding transcriptional regulator AlpA